MQKYLWQNIAVVALSVSASVSSTAYAVQGRPELTSGAAHVVKHRLTGRTRGIFSKPNAPIRVPGAAPGIPRAEAARQAIRRYGPLFGLPELTPEANVELIDSVVKPRRRGSRHRFRQFFREVPVLAGDLIVNLDESRDLTSMVGETSPDLSVPTQPSIDRAQARDTALTAVAKWYRVDQQTLQATIPSLWIVDPKLIVTSDRPPTLTWRLEVTDTGPVVTIRELLFIDAQTGGITLHINLIKQAKNRETYTASGTATLPGTLVCDETDPTCAAGDPDASDAHAYAGDSYDFFFFEHGRDGLNGAGQTIVSTVHWNDGFSCPNAFWTGAQMVYCNGLAVDDVVGHELAHGVTDNTSNLLYYYQSGAINESLSDVWGEFIDQTNGSGNDAAAVRWMLGEDLPSAIGVIRDMSNPPLFGDPDRMSNPLYSTSAADNGGVHTNSGVNNKAAYLMTDGGTFNGITINGLGISKVADIYYEAQTGLLVSGSDYADLHEALYQACLNLVGADGMTANDCVEVQKATDAVEMSTDPFGFNPDAAVCPGGEQSDDLFFDDMENGTVRWVFRNLAGSTTNAWINATGYASSGQLTLWGRDHFPNTDAVAEMNVDVVLPTAAPAYLHFDHAFGFEYGGLPEFYFDGGWIEYSTDGGATWNDAGTFIEDGQNYNATLSASNPNTSQPAFGSESHGYVSTRLNLGALLGQTVRFRWRVSTDITNAGPFGWIVDDVRVYTCGANLPPNQPPQIESVGASPPTITDAGTSSLSVTATDTDGPLTLLYSWSTSPGQGSVLEPVSVNPTAIFVPPNVSTTQVVAVTVEVDDGKAVSSTTIDVTVQDAGGDIPLIPGIPDGGAYGNNYGSNQHETVFTVAFEGTGTDLQLTLNGYDIDEGDEVAIYLNDNLIGHLRAGPDNSLNIGDLILILGSQQLSGINIIEFRQKTAGETWGVTSLLLEDFQPDVTLSPGIPHTGSYGHSFGTEVNALLVASFDGTGGDLQLSMTGYDIDFSDEVSVHINGKLAGFLSVGPDNELNGGDVFRVLASQQLTGTNVIEIRQKTPGFRWGVQSLLLDTFQPDLTLAPGFPDGGSYGHNYGTEVDALLVASFQETGADLLLSLKGFDVDFADELSVHLNGELVGYLAIGPDNNLNSGNSFVLSAAQQLSGTNVIEIRQKTPGWKWGVTELSLQYFQADATLTPDVPEAGQSIIVTQDFFALFGSSATDLQLSVNGHDIDTPDEVGVYLNGVFIGNLATGPDNGANGGNIFVIAASQLVPGANVLEFKQKTTGETWGVTDLLLSDFQPDVALTIGVQDAGSYGHNYVTEVGESLVATFQGTGTDLRLRVDGYDIDFNDEVGVYLNGALLFHLSRGPTDVLNAGDLRVIPLSKQSPGTNVLEFRQKTAGETWGVTGLLIASFQPATTLALGVPDAGSYGHNFGIEVNEVLVASFQGTTSDLELSLTGYDIDFVDEVSVHVNGELLGHLSIGPDNGLNVGDQFRVLASQQIAGANVIEIRQTTVGWKWGVTGLLLQEFQPDVTLTKGVTDAGSYGHNYFTEVGASLIVGFQSNGSNLQFSAKGYDIDFADELSVHLNGELVGHLSVGPDNALNGGDSFVLAAAQQVAGTNLIEFRQKTPGWKWGVTGLLLQDFQADVTLFLDNTETGEFGHNYGSGLNETVFTAIFTGTGGDLGLSLQGHDIDATDEIAVYLNGDSLGHLGVGPDNSLNVGDVFLISAARQRIGTNVLEIKQKTAGETWGVTNLLLAAFQPNATLTLGTPEAGQSIYGSTIFTAVFANTSVDIQLSVTGHDIDAADEIAVYLNRNLLGFLIPGADNGANGGDSFLIRAAEQLPATNVIEFRQKTTGESWGVTELLLDNFQPDITLTIGVPDPGAYGHNYVTEVGNSLVAAFQSTGAYLQFSVNGYDIDAGDEIDVYLNGSLLFQLRPGPNDDLNTGDSYVIPTSQQAAGTNVIEFRQKNPGETWGVTGILLIDFQPDVTLTVGIEDPGSYGHNHGTEVDVSLLAVFQGTDSDLQFSIRGYDIDFVDEISVHLNGALLGYLRVGPDNGFNTGDTFFVLASQQVSGTNVIEIRQKTAGWKWGVTDLLLGNFQPDVTLTVNSPTGGYGHNFGTEVGGLLVAAFQGTGGTLQFSLTGYDIDFADEIGVWVNGVLAGFLSVGPNNALNAGDSFPIAASEQFPGTNVIKLWQKNVRWKWGVTGLSLSN